VALESTDAVEALRPDSFADELRRQVLLPQQLAPNPHHQHVFVIGAVEDADASAGRQAPRRPPQKIMLQILGARMLEGVNLTALRIETGHDVLDDAIFAGRVHALEDDQECPSILGIELLLHSGEMAQTIGNHIFGGCLADIEQVPAGSKSESRKPRAFSTRKRSISFAKFMKRMSQLFIVWQGGIRHAGLSKGDLDGANI
jgi:hypothetical protein